MKFATISLLTLISFYCAYINNPSMVGVELKGKVISVKNDTMLVRTILTNTSADTIICRTWTCPRYYAYCIDNPNVKIADEDVCTKRIPTGIKILPHEDDTVFIPAQILPTFDTLNPKFRVGFNLVITHGETRNAIIKRMEETRNIYWSNPMVVTRK